LILVANARPSPEFNLRIISPIAVECTVLVSGKPQAGCCTRVKSVGNYNVAIPADGIKVTPTNDATFDFRGTVPLVLVPPPPLGAPPASVLVSASLQYNCYLPPGFTKSSISDTTTLCVDAGCVTTFSSLSGNICSTGKLTGTITVDGQLFNVENYPADFTKSEFAVGRTARTATSSRSASPPLLI
jgi:hypothetical protein